MLHVLKESSATIPSKTEEKPLILQVWKFLCLPIWPNFYCFSTCALEFFKLPLAHLQNFSFLAHWPGRRGRPPLLFFGNWNEWPVCWGKCPDFGYLWANFSLRYSKQLYMSFISDTFISNTGWDLIQNNNNLRFHKEHKKNQ